MAVFLGLPRALAVGLFTVSADVGASSSTVFWDSSSFSSSHLVLRFVEGAVRVAGAAARVVGAGAGAGAAPLVTRLAAVAAVSPVLDLAVLGLAGGSLAALDLTTVSLAVVDLAAAALVVVALGAAALPVLGAAPVVLVVLAARARVIRFGGVWESMAKGVSELGVRLRMRVILPVSWMYN